MVAFDAAHPAVHYPADRRFRIWLKPALLLLILLAIVLPVIAAWIQVAIVGLPTIAPVAHGNPSNIPSPSGFPLWARYCHFFNFLFVTMLVRSGLSILADHPRLYFSDACTPGSEWVRFTPLVVVRPHANARVVAFSHSARRSMAVCTTIPSDWIMCSSRNACSPSR